MSGVSPDTVAAIRAISKAVKLIGNRAIETTRSVYAMAEIVRLEMRTGPPPLRYGPAYRRRQLARRRRNRH